MNRRHCYRMADRLAVCAIPKVASTAIRKTIGLERGEYPDWYATAWEAQEQGYFVAGFVRHPLDRLVSAWADKTSEDNSTGRLRDLGFYEGMPFGEFVYHAHEDDRYEEDLHLQPQSRYIWHQRRFCFDFVGRFERLEEDWNWLSMIFKLPALPIENKSNRTPWQDYYDRETIDLAYKMYGCDLDMFGYGIN